MTEQLKESQKDSHFFTRQKHFLSKSFVQPASSETEIESSSRRFENLVEFSEWEVRNRLGLYPIDSSVSKYVSGLASKLKGVDDLDFRVSVYKGAPNAFVFPNGSAYVSDQLIDMAENEEQVLFVLAHERLHAREEHSKKSFERLENLEDFKKIILTGLGEARMQEWVESDLGAYIELDKLGINPLGGKQFFEKLRGLSKKEIRDLIHGSTTDRVLNLSALTHFKDSPSLHAQFHELPSYIKDEVREEQKLGKYISLYDQLIKSTESTMFFASVKTIEQMDLDSLLVSLPDVLRSFDHYSEGKDRYSHYLNFYHQLTPFLASKLWQEIVSELQALPNSYDLYDVSLIFHTILPFVDGISTRRYQDILFFEKDNRKSSLKVSFDDEEKEIFWTKSSLSFNHLLKDRKDLQKLLRLFDPAIYNKLGLKAGPDPKILIENVFQVIFENMIFENKDTFAFEIDGFVTFSRDFVNKVRSLYEDIGILEIKEDDIYEMIVSVASEYLEKDNTKALKQRIAEVKKGAIEAKTQVTQETDTKEAEEKFVDLFRSFSIPFKKRFSSTDAIKIFKSRESEYLRQLEDIFSLISIDSSDKLLVFLANFRKNIIRDPELWPLHLLCEEYWTELLNRFIKDLPFYNNFPNQNEADLFDFKVALLLANKAGSESLEQSRNRLAKMDMQSKYFDLDFYRKWYRVASSSKALAEETGVDVKTNTVIGGKELLSWRFGWEDVFREGIYSLLLKAVRFGSKEQFSQMLRTVTTEFSFVHFGAYESQESEREETHVTAKNKLLNDIFTTFTFDISNKDDLIDLYYLTTYLEDYSLAVRMQSVVWERLASIVYFDEGFSFLLQELEGKRLFSLKAINEFIEQRAQTHEEIEKANQRLLAFLKQDQTIEKIGSLVVTEEFFSEFFLKNKLEFLIACLGNGKDDSKLKRFLYEKWVTCYEYERSKTLDFFHLNEVMHRLYRLDPQSKYLLIRELLTGEDGVLTLEDSTNRKYFINYFLDNHIEAKSETDKKFLDVIRDVLTEVVKTADYDLLYFMIAPLIQDRMLVPPREQLSWMEIIKTEWPPRGYAIDEKSSIDIVEEDYFDSEMKEYKIFVDKPEADEIFQMITGTSEAQSGDEENRQLRRLYEDAVNTVILLGEQTSSKDRMSVTEFLIEAAQRAGAPGVRFLQLIGQYMELPPSLEKVFNEVYDKVEGQPKVTAHQTILREWPHGKNALVGLFNKLGGGSLLTVFASRRSSDGKNLAIKILNPNAAYHTETTYKLLNQVFSVMSLKDSRFVPSLTLLDDIKEWITKDINFERFLEKDRRFKKKHDGFSVDKRYRLGIPTSYFPQNKYFTLEDLIEGINLTNLEAIKAQGHNLKQIVTLLSKNFIEQIKDGLVHSDLHPGNIRITANDEVVLLDRNFYLEFSLKERLFLRSLQSSLTDLNRAVEMCVNYIQSQGVNVDQTVKQKILQQVPELSSVTDPTDRLLKLAVALRKEGITFPLKITLIIKDIFYLDRMAKKVGFSGIAEALKG